MKITLKVWRQDGPDSPGRLEEHKLDDVTPDMSFLEMLDRLNEKIIEEGGVSVSFDSDCREGICGQCGCVINGQPHGPELGTTTCQTHMRSFKDGDTIVIEPWRADAFPIVKDLVVDRSAFDRIIASGGYISVKAGPKPDGNAIPIPKPDADEAFEAAACIGCGACVAACPNASASLFTSAKISHLSLLPQGQVEAVSRVKNMVAQMDAENFGSCTNIGECQAACPKEIPIKNIARMKNEYRKTLLQ